MPATDCSCHHADGGPAGTLQGRAAQCAEWRVNERVRGEAGAETERMRGFVSGQTWCAHVSLLAACRAMDCALQRCLQRKTLLLM